MIPPSLNNAYGNGSNGGRFKTDRATKWAKACGWQIMSQRWYPIKGPVHLIYTFEDGGSKADLGNLEKLPTDLLVELQLIEGDSPKYVRSIHLQWGDVDGMQIEVIPLKASLKARGGDKAKRAHNVLPGRVRQP